MERFIVAEVSKNWVRGEPLVKGSLLVSQLFEQIINHWAERGYKLHSFSLNRLAVGEDDLNETIVAVFERNITDA